MPRFKSLGDLGKGAWKVAEMSPIKAASKAQKKDVANNKSRFYVASKVNSDPQYALFSAVKAKWPSAISEYPANIPGRKFKIDIVLIEHGLAIEMDGWQWHAKHLEDFKKDRRRQNLLVKHGWKVLRFTAEDVNKDITGCIDMIEDAIKALPIASCINIKTN